MLSPKLQPEGHGKYMDKRVKIPTSTPDGKVEFQEGTLIEVIESSEPWSEYKLSDGNVLRIKQAIMQVVKLDTKDAAGGDMYNVQAQPVVVVIPKV